MSEAEPRKASKFELPRGASVGKYEILRKIATGGMAEIYLARVRGTAGFEKLVVLKRILPGVAEDPTFVQMFLEEARLAATLQHSNIADVYDVGEDDGQYFFTMEFVYGQDVRVIRHEMKKRNEPVPLAAALAIIHGTASALDYAHDRRGPDGKLLGLVHRDVSASNVMVSYDGAVKLLDFGIARVMSATHKTQVGTLKGKIPYMSPEQCKGLPLDRRSDLFSLGVVLFELTVGRRPFRGDSDFAVMDQIVYQGAPKPSSLMPGYPAELEAIVMKLLEREPKGRYTTGDELVEDLDAFIQQYGLWISAKQLGKYMRTVFADRIQAWEEAEKAGVPFLQHVTESITSQSQQSELVTPPSAFPALPKRASQVMAAISPEVANSLRPTPTSMAAAEPPKSIDALHAKLGQKPVPKAPSRQVPAVAPPAAKAPPPAAPPSTHALIEPNKAGDGWDAPTTRFDGESEFGNESPTTSQPPEELERALAADPDADAALRAPTHADRELDAAATFQGFKAASAEPARPPARPGVSAFATDSARLDAPAYVPEPAAVPAPAPALESQPYVSLKPRGSRAIVFALVGLLAIGAGVAAFIAVSGSGPASAPAASGQGSGSEVRAVAAPPSAAPASDTEPADPKPADPKPADPKPADRKPADSKPADPRPIEETTPAAETRPTAGTRQNQGVKPRVTPRPPVVQRPHVVAKPPAVTPADKKPDPKEQTWDPNSPYLPQ